MEHEQNLAPEAGRQTAVPRVSVLLPVYNAFGTVAKAAQSVLAGNDVALELIIIDDGSTDGTGEVVASIARDPRVRLISHQNMGLSASLNVGIEATSAPFIARMDADDISAPGRLDSQLEFLDAHPDVVLVGGQIRRIVRGAPESISDFPLDHRDIVKTLLRGQHAICHPSVMMRKSAVTAVGGYWDEGVSEDWDLFLRLSEVGQLANIDCHMYDYVFHETGINASAMEIVRTNIGLAICNHRRRARGLTEFKKEEYLANLRVWERVRIDAQTRSLRAYRQSMLVGNTSEAARRLLLIQAALSWPPFAARRIASSISIPKLRASFPRRG